MDKNTRIKLHTGNTMPALGLGTWELNKDTADTIAYALDLGYRMIDTSSDYGTQPGIGEGIKKSKIPRTQIFLTTKVEENDDAYERTKSNLKELDLEYVDLMLIHRPPQNSAGEKLWEGLIKAKKEGLIKDIGVSNYPIQQIEDLIEASGEAPTVNQIEWSPFGYSRDMINYCNEKDIIIQAYSPLTREERLDDPALLEISRKYEKSPAQIMIRWDLQQGRSTIPKANKREHLEQNIDVFDFELDEGDMRALDSFNEHYSSLGSLPYV